MKQLLISVILFVILDTWSREQNKKVFLTKADLGLISLKE